MNAPLRKIMATYDGGVCTPYKQYDQVLECGHIYVVRRFRRNVDLWGSQMQAEHRRCPDCARIATASEHAKELDKVRCEWNLKHNVH